MLRLIQDHCSNLQLGEATIDKRKIRSSGNRGESVNLAVGYSDNPD